MADILTARLSEAVSRPELSRMWESQRAELMIPEILIEVSENSVTLRFHAAKADPGYQKLKQLFERAVHRDRPNCRIDWEDTTAKVA
jgi:hypothetical protein